MKNAMQSKWQEKKRNEKETKDEIETEKCTRNGEWKLVREEKKTAHKEYEKVFILLAEQ